jgi:hypothetical protein
MDFYGKKLATCSSDKTIKVFEADGRLIDTLKAYYYILFNLDITYFT